MKKTILLTTLLAASFAPYSICRAQEPSGVSADAQTEDSADSARKPAGPGW